ncbi:MAG: hypothetical protein DHS20C15_32470 [Planctomycetota bacterium]|nr:MAG: hypothetical protein DHS20C15_32470 [Planctomycetota bacterium]
MLGALLLFASGAKAEPKQHFELASDPTLEAHADCASCELARKLGDAWRWREQRRNREAPSVHSVHAQSEGRLIVLDDQGAWLFDGLNWMREAGWGGLAHAPYLDAELRGRNLILFHPRRTIMIPTHELGDDDPTHALLVARSDTELTHPTRNTDGSYVQAEGDRLWTVRPGGVAAVRIPTPGGVGHIGSVLRDDRERLWVTSEQGLHLQRDDGSWEHVHSPPHPPTPGGNPLVHALQLPQGPVFLPKLAEEGRPALLLTDSGVQSLPEWPRAGEVHHAAVSPEGVLVVALRYAGLLVLDGERWIELDPPAIVDSSTDNLTFSKDSGHLVLASRKGSLISCDLRSTRWEHVPLRDTELGGLVYTLALAGERGVWVGTHEGVGRVQEGKLVEAHQVAGETGLPLRAVASLLSEGERDLWVGGGARFPGVLHFDGERWQHDTSHPRLKTAGVHRLRRDPNGRLHALLVNVTDGTHLAGMLVESSEGSGWNWVDAPTDSDRPEVRDVRWDLNGAPVVLTPERVFRVLPDGWDPLPRPVLLHAGYRALHVDHSDRLWLGYGCENPGLARLDPDANDWTQLDEDEWSHTGAARFAPAPDGSLWIASELGLYRAANGTSHRVGADLVMRESAFSCLTPDLDGQGVWIGSLGDGLLHYRPDDHAPPAVTDLEGGSPSSSEGHNFAAHWFANDMWSVTPREQLRYEYRLDGGPWLEPSTTLLRLGPLDSGRHRFELSVIDSAGNRSAETSVVELTIPLPFWRSIPIVVLAGLVVAALMSWISLFLRRRRERAEAHEAEQELNRRLRSLAGRLMREQEAERRRMARDLHDELGQSLAAARMQLQLVGRSKDPERRQESRERAREALDDAISQMRHLSQRLRPPVLDDHGLEAAVRALANDVGSSNAIQVHLDIDLEGAEIHELVANHLYRIVGECLTNVTRHARARNVDLSLTRQSGFLQLSVHDDGVGTDGSRTEGRGIGMLGMQERAESLGGSFEIESQRGRFTMVRVSIPEQAPPGAVQGARSDLAAVGEGQQEPPWKPSESFSSTTTR